MMGNIQQIGARYVPKFADPMEWDKEREYEALTVVNYYGTSYTSKKPVPAGIDIGDTVYWAQTGNYNALLNAYIKKTDNIQTNVNILNGNMYDVTLGGVVGDGSAVNDLALTTIQGKYKRLYFPAGNYYFDNYVILSNCEIFLHPDAKILHGMWQIRSCYINGGVFEHAYNGISVFEGNNTICNAAFLCEGDDKISVPVYAGECNILNCRFNGNSKAMFGVWADSIAGTRDVTLNVYGCYFTSTKINAIFTGAKLTNIYGNTFTKCHLQSEPTGGGVIDCVGSNALGIANVVGNTITSPGGVATSGVEAERGVTLNVRDNYIDMTGGLYCVAVQDSWGVISNNLLLGTQGVWGNANANFDCRDNTFRQTAINIETRNPYFAGIIEERAYSGTLLKYGEYAPLCALVANAYIIDKEVGAARNLYCSFSGVSTIRVITGNDKTFEFILIEGESAPIVVGNEPDGFSVVVTGDKNFEIRNDNTPKRFRVRRVD